MTRPPKADRAKPDRATAHREPKSALAARRSFLKAVGASATALPFYRMLEDSVAQAASGQLPLKFVGIGAPHGSSPKYYARQVGEDDVNFDISYPDSCLRPFDQPDKYGGVSFKNKIAIFEGYDYGCGWQGLGGNDLGMHGCMGLFLTGSANNGGFGLSLNLQNASLDQYLAGLYGGVTRFRSIELTCQGGGAPITSSSIAAGVGGQLLTPLCSPEVIWNKFFAAVTVSNDPAALAAAAKKRLLGQSIFDVTLGDIQRMQSRLGGTEKQKLDQYLTVTRDLERQIDPTVAIAPGCQPTTFHPAGGTNTTDPNYYITGNNEANYAYFDRVCNFNIELLAQILICDLTRFGTIVLPGFPGSLSGPPLIPKPGGTADSVGGDTVTGTTLTDILVPSDFHIHIAHLTGKGIDAVERAAAAVQRYYHDKVARLMKRLQDGGNLDNTIILVGNEGGAGWHMIRNIPIILAGGGQAGFQLGRRIMAPGRTARPGNYPLSTDGISSEKSGPSGPTPTSHNAILAAVANVFRKAAGDAPITSFGTFAAHPEITNAQSIPGLT